MDRYLWLPTETGGAQLIGLYRNHCFHAVHTDHLGTPRLITDDENQPVWQWSYSAFGDNQPTGILKATTHPKQAVTNVPQMLKATNPVITLNLRFAGQYWDEESKLSYNYFRSYQGSQGRYTQSDPIGLAGGINTFSYVEGNPLMYTDPDGLRPNRPKWWNDGWAPKTPPGNCATADCAGGVLPTPKPNPTACEMQCGIGSADAAGRAIGCSVLSQLGKLVGVPGIPVTLACKVIDKRACLKKCEEDKACKASP